MKPPRADEARAARDVREAPIESFDDLEDDATAEVEVTARPKGTPFRCVDGYGGFEAGRQVHKVTPDE